jgi:hypothetical protein
MPEIEFVTERELSLEIHNLKEAINDLKRALSSIGSPYFNCSKETEKTMKSNLKADNKRLKELTAQLKKVVAERIANENRPVKGFELKFQNVSYCVCGQANVEFAGFCICCGRTLK